MGKARIEHAPRPLHFSSTVLNRYLEKSRKIKLSIPIYYQIRAISRS